MINENRYYYDYNYNSPRNSDDETSVVSIHMYTKYTFWLWKRLVFSKRDRVKYNDIWAITDQVNELALDFLEFKNYL